MYKVYCQGKKHGRWQEYSQTFPSRGEAEECMRKAEERGTCSVDGNLIKYKVNKIK